MKSFRVPDGEKVPDDILATTERLYRLAAEELDLAIAAIKAGQMGEVRAAQTAVRDLRITALHVLEERSKVDKLRKQVAGQVGASGALDLGAARVEIGRRLACLRNAGGGG